MLTTRLSADLAPNDDAHLVALLSSVCASFAGERNFRRITLLGDDGCPYRLIVARSEGEFMALMHALSTLSFEPSQAQTGVDPVLRRG